MKLLRFVKRQELEALKPTRAEEFLGLSALHGALLLKVQHRRSEEPLDLLGDVPPGLVVLGFGCAARLHLRGTEKGPRQTVAPRNQSKRFSNVSLAKELQTMSSQLTEFWKFLSIWALGLR